jgi:hypothetical protein
MPIWTDGRVVLVVTGHGVARGEGGPWEILRFSREGLRRDEDPPRVAALAVLDDGGESALLLQDKKGLRTWRRGAGVSACDAEGRVVTALARSTSGQLVVAAVEGDDVALRRANVAGGALRLGARVELPEAPRLASPPDFFRGGDQRPMWIDDRLDEDDDDEGIGFVPASLSHKGPDGQLPGEVRLVANRYGVGVTSTYNGLVAVLDSKTLEPRLSVRVPTEWDAYDIFCLPCAGGALVTVVANHRHTLFLFVDDDGKAKGARDSVGGEVAWGAEGPGLALSKDKALVSADSSLSVLALPALGTKAFGKLTGRMLEQASSADGKSHVVALVSGNYQSPHHWQMHRLVVGAKGVRTSDLDAPDFRPPPEPVRTAQPGRQTGAASFGLVADASTPWKARAGAVATVRLSVVNTGGPATGAWIELGGEAIARGHVEPVRATAAGAPVELRGRTELRALRLDAAPIVDGKTRPPPERPSIALDLEVRGVKPGKALLTVRVGPLGASGGSALQGRTFEVTPE